MTLLLVLRLLAVYFATCALAFFLVNRWVTKVSPAVAILLSLGPFLLTGKAMVTAGVYAPLDIAYQAHPLAARSAEMGIDRTRSPILGDVVYQEIPWRKAAREAVKNGRLPLWNRFQLAGEPLLAVQQPAVLHPSTLIGFLLPLAQAWTFEMSFRHFLALLAMYLFLRELGCGAAPALVGAAGWSFSDYMVFFAGYPLSAAAAPFPLLLLGLRRLARGPDRAAVGIVVAALLLDVTSGHPETLLHSVAGGGVYFLFELAFAARGTRGILPRALARAGLAGAITLGLSAVLLVPLVEALPHTAEHAMRTAWYAHVDKSASVPESLRRSIQDVVPWAFGFHGKGRHAIGFGEPAAYAGAVLLPLATVGLLSRRREKWPLALLTFLGLALWSRLPGVTDFVANLPLFDIGLNERLVFLAAFGISALASLGAQRFREEGGRALLVASVGWIAVIFALHREVLPTLVRLGLEPEFVRLELVLQVAPLAVAALVAAVVLASRAAPPPAVGLVLLVLLVVPRRFEAGRLYPTLPNRAFYPDLAVLDPIPREEPWRFAAVGFVLVPNAGTMYELEDVRGYEAMTFQPLTETFERWCVPQPIWFNRVDDPTTPFLAFLNVRWVLAAEDWIAPAGWKAVAEGDRTRLYRNPAALPRAFAPGQVRFLGAESAQREALGGITDFSKQGIVGGAAPVGADAWRANGPATVGIESYRPQRLELSIDARGAAVVGTSIPRWPGWKLEIDGRSASHVPYNRAFLGFAVPPGRHRAVLRYRPDGFSIGLAVSAATLAGCALAALLARRRTPRASAGR